MAPVDKTWEVLCTKVDRPPLRRKPLIGRIVALNHSVVEDHQVSRRFRSHHFTSPCASPTKVDLHVRQVTAMQVQITESFLRPESFAR